MIQREGVRAEFGQGKPRASGDDPDASDRAYLVVK